MPHIPDENVGLAVLKTSTPDPASSVAIAKEWSSCVALCVFFLCAAAVAIGLVDILHG